MLPNHFVKLLFLWLWLWSAAWGQTPEWRPVVFMDNEIFPSFLVATANLNRHFRSENPYILGYPDGLIGAYVRCPQAHSKVRLSIRVDEVVPGQDFDYELEEAGKVYLLLPNIVWDWGALRSSRQAHSANCSFRLTLNDNAYQADQVVSIRSLHEALLGYSQERFGQKDWIPTAFVLACYANEDHPGIDPLLREALDSGMVEAFDGYQSGEPEQVLRQVGAIWYTLQRRGIRYSSISASSSGNREVLSQHVRFLQDTLAVSQANCVDGTVMLASILRKIGIDSGIVTLPGHCLLVFRLGPKEELIGLETTMIGSVDLRSQPPTGKPDDPGRKASSENFLQAIQAGSGEFRKATPKIKASQIPQYSLTMLKDARERFKIYPLVSN